MHPASLQVTDEDSSYRDPAAVLAGRGVLLSHTTLRQQFSGHGTHPRRPPTLGIRKCRRIPVKASWIPFAARTSWRFLPRERRTGTEPGPGWSWPGRKVDASSSASRRIVRNYGPVYRGKPANVDLSQRSPRRDSLHSSNYHAARRLCRWTGYHKIVDAVLDAAREMRGG